MIDHDEYKASIISGSLQTKEIRLGPHDPGSRNLDEAAQALREGKLVVFPTETVYGLGANALDAAAVEHIYTAKGRPADNPLIVHVSGIADLESFVDGIPEKAVKLFSSFSPGPLTLVLRKKPHVPQVVTAGLETVAVRIPAHPAARQLIKLAGVPVAAPSANRSGRPSPTRAWHVIQDLWGRVSYIIDGGNCEYGLESTVLDLSGGRPVILRPGSITADQISSVIGDVCQDSGVNRQKSGKVRSEIDHPRSPGVKYRHYAPQARLLIAEPGKIEHQAGRFAAYLQEASRDNLKAGVFCSAEIAGFLKEKFSFRFLPEDMCSKMQNQIPAVIYGEKSDSTAAGTALFDALRQLDKEGVDIIIAEGIITGGSADAYMNRLRKAAEE